MPVIKLVLTARVKAKQIHGKSDSTASAVKTADVGVIPALGGMGGVMSTLLGVLAVFKRKRS